MDPEDLNEVRRLLDWIAVGIESAAFIGVMALIALVAVLTWK